MAPRSPSLPDLDATLANYLAGDAPTRAELQFRLMLKVADKVADLHERQVRSEERVGRHGRRLAALEHVTLPKRPPSPDDTGSHELVELVELRDEKKFWRRLAVTTVAGIFSALVISGVVWLIARILKEAHP